MGGRVLCIVRSAERDTGREVIYALHMQTKEDAQALARLLQRA